MTPEETVRRWQSLCALLTCADRLLPTSCCRTSPSAAVTCGNCPLGSAELASPPPGLSWPERGSEESLFGGPAWSWGSAAPCSLVGDPGALGDATELRAESELFLWLQLRHLRRQNSTLCGIPGERGDRADRAPTPGQRRWLCLLQHLLSAHRASAHRLSLSVLGGRRQGPSGQLCG